MLYGMLVAYGPLPFFTIKHKTLKQKRQPGGHVAVGSSPLIRNIHVVK